MLKWCSQHGKGVSLMVLPTVCMPRVLAGLAVEQGEDESSSQRLKKAVKNRLQQLLLGNLSSWETPLIPIYSFATVNVLLCSLHTVKQCTLQLLSVQCAVCSVQFAVCSVPCAVCSVQCAVYSIQCTVCSVQRAACSACSLQCAICSVQGAFCITNFAVCSVKLSVCSVMRSVCSVCSVQCSFCSVQLSSGLCTPCRAVQAAGRITTLPPAVSQDSLAPSAVFADFKDNCITIFMNLYYTRGFPSVRPSFRNARTLSHGCLHFC